MSQFHKIHSGLILLFTAFAGLAAQAAPERIVTVGGAATEIVFALGAGDRVVAVDLSSTYPEEVAELPQVGYIRNISPEGILSMKPDLVVTTESLGPPAAKQALKHLAVPVVWCPEPSSVESLAASLEAVSAQVGNTERAREILAETQAQVARAQTEAEAWPARPRVVFFLRPPTVHGAGMAGGAGTRANALIALAGGENAAAAIQNFQPMSLEALIQAQPEVILVGISDGHGADPESVKALGKLPGLASVPAVASGAVHGVPLDDLNFGPRLGEAVTRWHARLAATR